MHLQRVIRIWLAMVLTAMTSLAAAENDPRQVVMEAVERMTSRIEAEREQLETNPDRAKELVREELGDLVRHVLVHELAHHFGWSDDDIALIDRWWE